MTKNEFGKTIYVNTGMDISTATAYAIVFTKPDGTVLTVNETTGVSIGSIDVLSGCNETFTANEYLEYITVDGDINQSGEWTLRSDIEIDGKRLIGSIDGFTVKE